MPEASEYSPFNNQGEDPKQQVYKWGMNVKVIKGGNVDVTYGFKSSTVLGVSNSNVLGGYFCLYAPLYAALILGQKLDINIGRNYQFVLGSATKNVGGEYVLCRGDKVEYYKTNCYKYITGSEIKIELKDKPFDGPPERATMVGDYKNYAENFTAYNDYQKNTVMKSIESKTLGYHCLQAGAGAGGVKKGMEMLVTGGGLKQEVQGDSSTHVTGQYPITGTDAVGLFSDRQARVKVGTSSLDVKPGQIKLTGPCNLGVPGGPPPVNVTASLDNLQNEINQAKAAVLSLRSQTAKSLTLLASKIVPG